MACMARAAVGQALTASAAGINRSVIDTNDRCSITGRPSVSGSSSLACSSSQSKAAAIATGSSHSPVFGRAEGSTRGRLGDDQRRSIVARPRVRSTRVEAKASSAAAPTATIKYNRLGSSDLEVSEVCMGTMTFQVQNDEESSHHLMDLCVDEGINFFDTAEMYPFGSGADTIGSSEEFLGRWLKTQKRDKIIIATKVSGRGGIEGRGSYTAGNRKVPQVKEFLETRLDRSNVLDAVEGSLRRLQVDYIDLYQTHWPDRYVPFFGKSIYDVSQERPFVPFEETVETIGQLIKEGKIRHWGISNETTFGVCKIVEVCDKLGVPRPVSIQNCYSLTCRNFDTELAEACSPSNYNISLLSWSPLAGGALSGKYLEGRLPEGSRFSIFGNFMVRFIRNPLMENAILRYKEIADSIGITPAQLALAFCKSRWFMGSTIIGATSPQQLKENIEAFSIELSPETLQAINAVHIACRDPSIME